MQTVFAFCFFISLIAFESSKLYSIVDLIVFGFKKFTKTTIFINKIKFSFSIRRCGGASLNPLRKTITEANKMGMYQYIREAWKKPKENLGDLWKRRLVRWRREDSTVRVERPTRIDRARSLGYKAKPGFIIVRQRVPRGGRMREKFHKSGRRPKTRRRKKVVSKNYQQVAEERANKKYPNCEVLNSYYVAEDGKYGWYEIILVDKANPSILADKKINWIADKQHTRRVYRGLTGAGRKSRGLTKKGKGTEKIRPSQRANMRKAK